MLRAGPGIEETDRAATSAGDRATVRAEGNRHERIVDADEVAGLRVGVRVPDLDGPVVAT